MLKIIATIATLVRLSLCSSSAEMIPNGFGASLSNQTRGMAFVAECFHPLAQDAEHYYEFRSLKIPLVSAHVKSFSLYSSESLSGFGILSANSIDLSFHKLRFTSFIQVPHFDCTPFGQFMPISILVKATDSTFQYVRDATGIYYTITPTQKLSLSNLYTRNVTRHVEYNHCYHPGVLIRKIPTGASSYMEVRHTNDEVTVCVADHYRVSFLLPNGTTVFTAWIKGHTGDCLAHKFGHRHTDGRCYYLRNSQNQVGYETVRRFPVTCMNKDALEFAFMSPVCFTEYGPIDGSPQDVTFGEFFVEPVPYTISSNDTGLYVTTPDPVTFSFPIRMSSRTVLLSQISNHSKEHFVADSIASAHVYIPSVLTTKHKTRRQACIPKFDSAYFSKLSMYTCNSPNWVLIISLSLVGLYFFLWAILFTVRVVYFIRKGILRKRKKPLMLLALAPFVTVFLVVFDFVLDFAGLLIMPLVIIARLCGSRVSWLPIHRYFTRRVPTVKVYYIKWLVAFAVTSSYMSHTAAQYPGTTGFVSNFYPRSTTEDGSLVTSYFVEDFSLPMIEGFKATFHLFDKNVDSAGSIVLTLEHARHVLTTQYQYTAFKPKLVGLTKNADWYNCAGCRNADLRCFVDAYFAGDDPDCAEDPAEELYYRQHQPHSFLNSQTGLIGFEYAFCSSAPDKSQWMHVFQADYQHTVLTVHLDQRDASGKVVISETFDLHTYDTTHNIDEDTQLTFVVSNFPQSAYSDRIGFYMSINDEVLETLSGLPFFDNSDDFYKAASWPDTEYDISSAVQAPIPTVSTLACSYPDHPFSLSHMQANFPSVSSATSCILDFDQKFHMASVTGFVNSGDEFGKPCTSATAHCVPLTIRKLEPIQASLRGCEATTFNLKIKVKGVTRIDEEVETVSSEDLSGTYSGFWAKDNGATLSLSSSKPGMVRFLPTAQAVMQPSVAFVAIGVNKISFTALSKAPTSISLTDGTSFPVSGSLDDPPEYDADGDDSEYHNDTSSWNGFGFPEFALLVCGVLLAIAVIIVVLYCLCRSPLVVHPHSN